MTNTVEPLSAVVADAFGGGTPSTKRAEYWDGDQPWTTTAVISDDDILFGGAQRYITSAGLEHSSARIAPKGSVLVGTRVGVGKVVVTTTDVAINQDLTVLVPTDRVLPEFLAFCLKRASVQQWFAQNKRGSTIKGVPRADLLGIPVPTPPLSRQRQIVRGLRAIHDARRASERVIAATRKCVESVLAHYFGTSLNPDSSDDLRHGWRLRQLEGIASIERGKFAHRPRNDPAFYGGDTPFIQTGDVTAAAARDGRVRSYSQTLNEKGLAVSRVFPKGTILITIAANIGFTAVLDFDSAFPDSVVGITPMEEVDERYLNYYLSTQQPAMDRAAPRGTQKNINIQFLRPWPVKVAPRAEQIAIANTLDALNAKARADARFSEALGALFTSALEQVLEEAGGSPKVVNG